MGGALPTPRIVNANKITTIEIKNWYRLFFKITLPTSQIHLTQAHLIDDNREVKFETSIGDEG